MFLASFLLSFCFSCAFPSQSQAAINAYTLSLPAFNIISGHSPTAEYDAAKVFAFVAANNLLVLGAIYLIGHFGLSLLHPLAFGATTGCLLGTSITQGNPVLPLAAYASLEAANYLLAAAVTMRSAADSMGFESFTGHLLDMARNGPKRNTPPKVPLNFLFRVNVPLTLAIALMEAALAIGIF